MAISSAFMKIFDFALMADLETFEELDFLNVREACLTLINASGKQVEKVDDRSRRSGYWPFKVARAYVRRRKLKKVAEWWKYAKSKDRVRKIPTNPQTTYKNDWKNWGDWLGKNDQIGMRELKAYANKSSDSANVPYEMCTKNGFKLGAFVEEQRREYSDDSYLQACKELLLTDTDLPEELLMEYESRREELSNLPDWHWELQSPALTIVEVDGPIPQVAKDWYPLWHDLRELILQCAPHTYDYKVPRGSVSFIRNRSAEEQRWVRLTLHKRLGRSVESGVVVQTKGTFGDLVLEETLRHLQTVLVEKCFACEKLFLREKRRFQDYCSSKCYQKDYAPVPKHCQKLAEEFLGVCLPTDSFSPPDVFLWQCDQGHEWEDSFDMVQSRMALDGVWCEECDDEYERAQSEK